MPSAKQIKARKAFAKKYAKKGKRKAKSTKPKKSKFDKTGKKKDMVAGVDYYKDMQDTLGTKKKPKTTQEWTAYYDEKWDKKMQEFLNRTNNES